MRVKSKVDVITNSSTEVFVLKLTDKEVKWLENKRQAEAREALKRNKNDKVRLKGLSDEDRKRYTTMEGLLEVVEECSVTMAPCFTRKGLLWGLNNKEDRKQFQVNNEWDELKKVIGGKAVSETEDCPDFRTFNKWLAENIDWISEKMKDAWLMEIRNYDEKIYDTLNLFDHIDKMPKDDKVLYYDPRH